MEFFDIESAITDEQRKNPVVYEIVLSLLEDAANEIPKSVGERIVKEYNDKGYQIGISRAKIGSEDVFKNGFKVFGDTDTSYGISYYDGSPFELAMLLKQYNCAAWYKNSNKLYIFKIPKESILYYEEGKSMPILYPTDEENEQGNKCYRVLPEYILGYFPVGKEVEDLKDLVENPNYKEVHDYKPDGLYFEDRVMRTKEELESIDTDNVFIKIIKKIKEKIKNIRFGKQQTLPEGQPSKAETKSDNNFRKDIYQGEVKPSERFINNSESQSRHKRKLKDGDERQ